MEGTGQPEEAGLLLGLVDEDRGMKAHTPHRIPGSAEPAFTS